jgi:hypothetical protein
VAIDTTRRTVADSLPYAIRDLSLCHGLGGAADVLLCAPVNDEARRHGMSGLVTQLGHVVLERYSPGQQRLPCGIAGESTPGLFLGHSGIGWLFLRLHDRGTASPLLPKISLRRMPLGSVGSIGCAFPMSLRGVDYG